jgi:Bacterial dnaA protein helix-turn-helix
MAPAHHCNTAAEVREAARCAAAWRRSVWGTPTAVERPVQRPWPLLAATLGSASPPTLPAPPIKSGICGSATTRRIIHVAAEVFCITEEELLGHSRKCHFVVPRQAAMAVARRFSRLSLPQLGRIFGRDHTTVLYAVRRAEHDAKLQEAVAKLLAALAAPAEAEGADV